MRSQDKAILSEVEGTAGDQKVSGAAPDTLVTFHSHRCWLHIHVPSVNTYQAAHILSIYGFSSACPTLNEKLADVFFICPVKVRCWHAADSGTTLKAWESAPASFPFPSVLSQPTAFQLTLPPEGREGNGLQINVFWPGGAESRLELPYRKIQPRAPFSRLSLSLLCLPGCLARTGHFLLEPP